MRKNLKDINKKLAQAAGIQEPSDKQLGELAKLADKYKNKSPDEIEKEMMKIINNFSSAEKTNMIKKLQMLKQMNSLLDHHQRKKVDMFIRLLSK